MATTTTHVDPETAAPTSASTMQAIVQRTYGSADVLELDVIARPSIGPREALIEVRAAGLDRGTWHLMTGTPAIMRLACGLRRPKALVPGLDLAGVVVAVGDEVTRVHVGDEVLGIGKGSFAQWTAAHEDKLVRKPESLTFEQSAALPVSGLTALRGLCEVGRVAAGQHVLITGASGGVGSYAVQIAVALGATVTGVCSAAKADLVRSLGATHVLDYTTDDVLSGDVRYDLILDLAGNASLRRLRGALTRNGTLVIAGGEQAGSWFGGIDRQLRGVLLSPFVSQRITTFIAEEHHVGIDRLLELVGAGHLAPAVERTFPLPEAADAMRHLEAGRARGKLVITM